MIYLKGSIDTVLDRILVRNRPGEAENISRDYLEKLENFYQRFLKKLSSKMDQNYLIVIDTDKMTAEEVQQECIERVQDLLNKHFKSAAQ